MQCIPEIQTNSPLATLIPLCFVISLGILKELIAEVKRYKEDKAVNNTPVMKLDSSGQWVKSTLATIRVGDMIKINDFDMVPADCILIRTASDTNEAFVKTAALDGERNLKPKMSIKQLEAVFGDIAKMPDAKHCPVKVECLPPHKDMYSFEGRLGLGNGTTEGMDWYPLDLNQFIHRGSFLENSGYVVALVVHTGAESKLIMNLGQYRFKRSAFEKILNWVLVFNLSLALVLSLIGAF
jgi:magnesium-transporting ATPase (P-type)